MRVAALFTRILRQILRDKRTLGLLIFAPILVLSMVYLVFNGNEYTPKFGLVNAPAAILSQIDKETAKISEYPDRTAALEDLGKQQIDGFLQFEGISPSIFLEGSDPSKSGAVMKWVQGNLTPNLGESHELKVDYLHGSNEMEQFDYFGPFLLGFFIFLFVFLIAGISFLRERTTGTLERLLSSPLRKWEIVAGYILGFGVFSFIAVYAIYVLGMLMEGPLVYVLLITFMLSLTALTLGTLLSAFAHNEFQMMQFIPIIVIPQIFFSGLFNLDTISPWLSWIGPVTPLYYAADALKDVMIRGSGWNEIYLNLLALLGFSLIFIFCNIFALRKYRRI